MWKNLSVAIAFTTLISVGIAGKGFAVSLTESGDAGDSLGTAQAGTEPAGTTLDSINGSTNSPGDIDLYLISIAGGSFSASTVGSTLLDTQLFLFNSSGIGVAASFDSASGELQAALSLTGLADGIYYLGISTADYDPVSAGGPIFVNTQSGTISPANGPGANSPLSGWSTGFGEVPQGYSIGNITGAQFASAQATGVPFEFSPTLGVLILAAWGAATKLKSK